MEFPLIIQKFNPNMEVLDNIKSPQQFNLLLEPISKIRLVFRAQVELCEIPPPGARNGEKEEHTRSM